ncbi:MAG TPA: DUF4350 domain-containing protein [Candidatus Binatia bacterium]|nr:DUF4350 domain-containing protein [Candidatus Binatia bacterium]
MKRSFLILFLLAAGGFVFGLVQLFNLRFQAGDVYPPYSSFRADPLGTKALYESIDQLLPASRHLQQVSKLPDGAGVTLFCLGVESHDLTFHKKELQRLEAFVASGGRLIISLVTRYKRAPAPFTPPPPPGKTEVLISAAERWGFTFHYAPLTQVNGDYQHPMARRIVDDPNLPAQLVWHTAVCTTNLDESWKTLYVISNSLAVVIGRPLGAGSIVLCTDSFPFSNEALLGDRHTGLLSWFIGPARRVIFDERHLGVYEEPGLATLFRRYRLHGLAATLLFLALMFIWKASDRFLPASATSIRATEAVIGRDTAAGFVNLLRRNIPRGELIATCIAEWKRSQGHHVARQRLERIQAVIDAENEKPPARRNPVRIYRSLSRILSTRRSSIS